MAFQIGHCRFQGSPLASLLVRERTELSEEISLLTKSAFTPANCSIPSAQRFQIVEVYFAVVDCLNDKIGNTSRFDRTIVHLAIRSLDIFLSCCRLAGLNLIQVSSPILQLAIAFLYRSLKNIGPDPTREEFIDSCHAAQVHITEAELESLMSLISDSPMAILRSSDTPLVAMDFYQVLCPYISGLREKPSNFSTHNTLLNEREIFSDAEYLIDISTFDEYFMNILPSSLALSALLIAMSMSPVDYSSVAKEMLIYYRLCGGDEMDKLRDISTRLQLIYAQSPEGRQRFGSSGHPIAGQQQAPNSRTVHIIPDTDE